ncbi:MAG: sensor domain-containing diguanylate cyclase [Myxococcales bacterium]|nr:sensor domain-containing diguanylate cyclase [Myxococcales bacterium]
MTAGRILRRTDSSPRRARTLARRSLAEVTASLLRVAEDLRRSRQVESTLQSVARTAVAITGSIQATLRLLDESGQRLLISARFGPSVHRRGAAPFRPGEGFIGWVVIHRRPALTNRVRRDPRFVLRRGQAWTPTAIMAVPLMARRDCIGVLSVARRDGRPYRSLELDVLTLLGEISVPYLEIARLRRLSESDALTLLHNRRYLAERLPLEIDRAQRSRRPLSALFLDLDRFKRINDRFGHPVGDQVLQDLAERLRQGCRSEDVLARVGGEEFVILLPDTNLAQARRVAQRLRLSVKGTPFITTAGPLDVTVSLGVARLRPRETGDAFLRRADQALYLAKRRGRDRVEVSGRH